MTSEIKAVARRHLETDGANLSLRAVARDMGMASSALYRYFASRDDLLTALILDAYNALGETVEAADAAVTDRGDYRTRWLAAARAVRTWALAHPAEVRAAVTAARCPGTRRRKTPSRPRSGPRRYSRASCRTGSPQAHGRMSRPRRPAAGWPPGSPAPYAPT